MKRHLCAVVLGLLAVTTTLAAYDSSPNKHIIIPECIWATATGGGTWVTEVQVTAHHNAGANTTLVAVFYYGTSYRIVTLGTLGSYRSVKYTNILSTMQSLDPSFTYSGRVGALWLTVDDDDKIWARPEPTTATTARPTRACPGWTGIRPTTMPAEPLWNGAWSSRT